MMKSLDEQSDRGSHGGSQIIITGHVEEDESECIQC